MMALTASAPVSYKRATPARRSHGQETASKHVPVSRANSGLKPWAEQELEQQPEQVYLAKPGRPQKRQQSSHLLPLNHTHSQRQLQSQLHSAPHPPQGWTPHHTAFIQRLATAGEDLTSTTILFETEFPDLVHLVHLDLSVQLPAQHQRDACLDSNTAEKEKEKKQTKADVEREQEREEERQEEVKAWIQHIWNAASRE